MPYADEPRRGHAPPAATAPPTTPDQEGGSWLSRLGVHMTPELRQGLLQAGLAMMATTRGGPGSFLGAAGEAGMAGVGAYNKTIEAQQKQAEQLRKAAIEEENQNLKVAATPVLPNGKLNPAWVRMKEKEAEISNEPRTPFGWTVNDNGDVTPTPHGPMDPAYQQQIAEAKAGPELSQEAIDLLADRVRAGDDRALTNLGRGIQGAREVKRVQAAVAEREANSIPINPQAYQIMSNRAQQSANSKALGSQAVREANVRSSINEADKTFPMLEQASAALPRTNYPLVNKAIESYRTNTGSPEQRQFGAAIQASITAYSQAMSRTGANTVHAQQHAEALFSKADGHEAIKATIQQLHKEMEAALAAPEETRQHIIDQMMHKNTLKEAETGASLPEAARKQLEEGHVTVFGNGQKWTLKNGQPAQVQ
jgi:hypothetical protein